MMVESVVVIDVGVADVAVVVCGVFALSAALWMFDSRTGRGKKRTWANHINSKQLRSPYEIIVSLFCLFIYIYIYELFRCLNKYEK